MIGSNEYVINFGFQLLLKIFTMFLREFVQVTEFNIMSERKRNAMMVGAVQQHGRRNRRHQGHFQH